MVPRVGPSLWSIISEKVAADGTIPFSVYQNLALYHPQSGFYAEQGAAGRAGDFITSPEVGVLFGQVLAQALSRWWKQMGRPDPFYVIEGGAGTGTLAASILEADPPFLRSLRYITVERSGLLRGEQTGRLPLVPYAELMEARARSGPLAAALDEMPTGRFTGVILANELLDNLPVDLYERRGREWHEVRIGFSKEGGLDSVLVPVEDRSFEHNLHTLAPNSVSGSRIAVQTEAVEWVRNALDLLDRGRLVVFDYMRTTRWMTRHDWEDWLRTYRAHRPGTSPFEAPGSQDITCEVAVDQLAAVRQPDRDRTQEDFLEAHGLGSLVADARDVWHARAEIGDLGAAKARGRVQEGRALTDPNGLGRYRVLEWDVK